MKSGERVCATTPSLGSFKLKCTDSFNAFMPIFMLLQIRLDAILVHKSPSLFLVTTLCKIHRRLNAQSAQMVGLLGNCLWCDVCSRSQSWLSIAFGLAGIYTILARKNMAVLAEKFSFSQAQPFPVSPVHTRFLHVRFGTEIPNSISPVGCHILVNISLVRFLVLVQTFAYFSGWMFPIFGISTQKVQLKKIALDNKPNTLVSDEFDVFGKSRDTDHMTGLWDPLQARPLLWAGLTPPPWAYPHNDDDK